MARPAARSEKTSEQPLSRYNAKRDFKVTAEPPGLVPKPKPGKKALGFVVQKHWASRLHYDFRLELDGVMLSWAVPKGPSFDPAIKQMAIHVEDHPLSYNTFEGTIPKGQYGAGTVIVWDNGTWEPVGDPHEGLAKGKLVFKLHGQKLAGLWELVRISKPGEKKQEQWLLLKKRGDPWARSTAEYDVITALPDSVVANPLGLVEERESRSYAQSDGKSSGDAAKNLGAAIEAQLPSKLEPQLATLVEHPPATGHWLVESKFDGYRMLVRIEGEDVRLFTRNGNDWTSKLKAIAAAVQELGIDSGWLDGEIVVLNEHGVPDFNALQNAIDNSRTKSVVMFVFDVPFLGGMDLRSVPLVTRRSLLKELFDQRAGDVIRFSESFDLPPQQLLDAACQLGLEGVMLKRSDAPYVSGRTESWLKLKCMRRQEFAVLGFTDRNGAPTEVGSLLLGYHEGGVLRYGGSVGTGWNAATGRELRMTLNKLKTDVPPVDPATVKQGRWARGTRGEVHWVKPSTVVEVAFGEWTPDGHIRHPSFRGVRVDKPARSITREPTLRPPQQAAYGKAKPSVRPSIKVTHPERVIDPSTGLRKVDLVHYYESVADRMLPHLKDRPVSLVRAPTGITGELFFQKHPETRMPGLTELDPALWPGHEALLAVDGPEALVAAAQMNVVEFHTWNSRTKRIEQPDRFVLDLDPGEGVTWQHVKEAALLVRALLEELQLKCWLKTSGGKGLHVVVPLAPKLHYDVVKDFSQAIVQHMARTIPQRFVAKSGGANRVGRIFIDYLRNGHAQTTAAAFSARARPGLGVSMPVAWEQLNDIKRGDQWTIATAREYLSFESTDPWSDYWKTKQTLTRAMRLMDR